jgi:IS30 family transposase
MTKRTYSHFLGEEKDQIAYLRVQDAKISDIGEGIGRNPGTFSQELKPNKSSTYNVYLANREYQRGVKRKDLSVQRLKCVLNLVEI